ncbi:MAG: hydrogenase formation protein HypD [Alphaproteobacteria bacterium]|nr:hydrogenase formation protein HypD [Alphaproteobacteria bacterium]
MRFRDEYRDADTARKLADTIARTATRPWTIMEVCGGQTHAILRFGIDQMLPDGIELIHGPGCPVCVTPVDFVDKAIEIAELPAVTLCSFGDMLRVPGSRGDLLRAKSRGADVRVVYSPLDAVDLAAAYPDREIVFFAVGFETTAPANAMAAYRARRAGLANFSMLTSHVLVPPAMRAVLEAPDGRIDGFLAAGHVCTVMGTREYEPIAHAFGVPIVVTGFEPVDILEGIYLCVRQLESGRNVVENQYARAVRTDGNGTARAIMGEVFRVVTRNWRGLGDIADSGLALAGAYAAFDAENRFGAVVSKDAIDAACISGAILRGESRPTECPAFGTRCTPDQPLGVTMVSSEGACAAYHRYRRADLGTPRQ